MLFVDDNGITYSNESIGAIPENWEGIVPQFVTWVEPNRLSTGLYYIKPIRILTNKNTASCTIGNSATYRIVNPKLLSECGAGGNVIELSGGEKNGETLGLDKLTLTLYDGRLNNGKNLFVFYLLVRNDDEETVLKNVLLEMRNIHTPEENVTSHEISKECAFKLSDETDIPEFDGPEYSILRIGATFYGLSEELVINGTNRGIELPADICKAFWECDFGEYNRDNVAHRDKLKELLMNYMGIKGECGNVASALKSLRWFGWGNKIELSQLVVLENRLKDFYLNDYFESFIDIPETFRYFRKTTYVTLKSLLRVPDGLGNLKENYKTLRGNEPIFEHYFEDGLAWKDNPEIFDDPKFTGTRNNYDDTYDTSFETRFD